MSQIRFIKPETEEIKPDALISMPAITLHQPWASLIAQGIKQFETRSWGTTYRGKLAIHAGKKHENDDRLLALLGITQEQMTLGAIVAFVDLIDCIEITESFASQQSDTELMCGDWSITEPARYAWRLENVEILNSPIPATGKQGMWNWCNRNKIEIVTQPSQPNVAVADIQTTHKLADLESTIERGFAQAADALRQIRDLKLYEEYGTFAEYCEHRWGFSDRYARNLLKASEVLTNLSIGGTNGSDLPTNERQIRPLANLEPEQQKAAWEDARAEAAASGEKVSGKHVGNAVARKKTGTGDSERRAASPKSPVIPAVSVEIVDTAVLQVEQSLPSLSDADLNQIIDLVSAEILKRKK